MSTDTKGVVRQHIPYRSVEVRLRYTYTIWNVDSHHIAMNKFQHSSALHMPVKWILFIHVYENWILYLSELALYVWATQKWGSCMNSQHVCKKFNSWKSLNYLHLDEEFILLHAGHLHSYAHFQMKVSLVTK